MNPSLTPKISGRLMEVFARAVALITEHLSRIASHRRCTTMVLRRVLLPYLVTRCKESVGAAPIRLHRRDLTVLRTRVQGGRPGTRSARRREAALIWLLVALAEAHVLTVPKFRWVLQRYRDLAADLGLLTFTDEGRIAALFVPKLRALVLGESPSPDPEIRALALYSLLIFEAGVVWPNPQALLKNTPDRDFHPVRGVLTLRPQPVRVSTGQSRRAAHRGGRSPVPVSLPPLERLALAAELLRRHAADPRRSRRERAPLLLPLVTRAKGGVPPALRALWRRLGGPTFGDLRLARFVEAARLHAAFRLPPICTAVLAGRLLTCPTTEREVEQLEGVATADSTPPKVLPPPVLAKPERVAAPEWAEWDGAALAVYRPAIDRLTDLLKDLRSPRDRHAVAPDAASLLRTLQADIACLRAPVPAPLENLPLLMHAFCAYLANPKLKINTVLARMNQMPVIIERIVGERPLRACDEEDWIEVTDDPMTVLGGKAVTLRHYKANLQASHGHLRDHTAELGIVVPEVDWRRRELRVPWDTAPVPLVLPEEVEAVRTALVERLPAELVPVVTVFIILGYGLGMRRREAAELRLRHVHTVGELLIQVVASKTRAGRRNLPSDRLLSVADWEYLRAFLRQRLRETKNDLDAPLLGTPALPDGLDPAWLSQVVSAVLKEVTGKPVSYHDLRHTFASLFLLRWWVAKHGPAAAPALGTLLASPLFTAEALARFRCQFGPGPEMPLVTHPVQVLSIRMGHASPETTCRSYVHTLCWLQRLATERPLHAGELPDLSVKAAALAAGVTERTVRNWAAAAGRGEGRISVACLLAHQADRLKEVLGC
jgi:integrase